MKGHLGIIVLALAALAPLNTSAQTDAPLQVDARIRVNRNGVISFQRQLDPGPAMVRGRIQTQPGRETALVTLEFDYRVNADFALDEIISLIVISIEDAAGNTLSTVTIDPNTINLNPNRVPLEYSATLYIPTDGPRPNYIVHLQVFGNYE
jgi:hypothetical protein